MVESVHCCIKVDDSFHISNSSLFQISFSFISSGYGYCLIYMYMFTGCENVTNVPNSYCETGHWYAPPLPYYNDYEVALNYIAHIKISIYVFIHGVTSLSIVVTNFFTLTSIELRRLLSTH